MMQFLLSLLSKKADKNYYSLSVTKNNNKSLIIKITNKKLTYKNDVARHRGKENEFQKESSLWF
jgi:hypothetical protein